MKSVPRCNPKKHSLFGRERNECSRCLLCGPPIPANLIQATREGECKPSRVGMTKLFEFEEQFFSENSCLIRIAKRKEGKREPAECCYSRILRKQICKIAMLFGFIEGTTSSNCLRAELSFPRKNKATAS